MHDLWDFCTAIVQQAPFTLYGFDPNLRTDVKGSFVARASQRSANNCRGFFTGTASSPSRNVGMLVEISAINDQIISFTEKRDLKKILRDP